MRRAGGSEPARISSMPEAMLLVGQCLASNESPYSRELLQKQLGSDLVDWIMVAEAANRHCLGPALWSALDRKCLGQILPANARKYFGMLHALNVRRNLRIREQAREAALALNRRGLRPVLMKGAQFLFEEEHDPGARMMTDIDMLVAEDELPVAKSVLRSIGYRVLGQASDDTHAWTFYRPMSLVTIDLHRHVGPQRDLLPAGLAVERAIALPGVVPSLRGLSPADRVLLLIMTFGIFERDYASGRVPLRGLHDLAALCPRYANRMLWKEVADVVREGGFERPARAWLHMAHIFLEIPAPPVLPPDTPARLHLQRCMLQLSHPIVDRLVSLPTSVIWPFNRYRIDYRYRCGREGPALNAARLRHAASVLARHGRRLARRPASAEARCRGVRA